MTTPSFDRRQFLIGSGVVLGAAAVGLTACSANPWLQIERLGQEYIARVPAEGSQAVLKPLLGNPGAFTNPQALLATLAPQVVDDYANDNTIMMSGTLMSITEARVAAFWATRPKPTTTTTTTGP